MVRTPEPGELVRSPVVLEDGTFLLPLGEYGPHHQEAQGCHQKELEERKPLDGERSLWGAMLNG
jgi:hypothetical protein